MTRPDVVLVHRYDGVRTALREQVEAAGAGRVVAEAGSLDEARGALVEAPGAVVVTGLDLPDGPATDLLGGTAEVHVVTWLPADEHALDLSGAASVIGPPLIPGLLAALRGPGRCVGSRHGPDEQKDRPAC